MHAYFSRQHPLYLLGEKIITMLANADMSGLISETVGGTKASKEINFTVQLSDGKVAVSVTPPRSSALVAIRTSCTQRDKRSLRILNFGPKESASGSGYTT